MSVFNSWTPGDVFGEDNINNNNLNNNLPHINKNQQFSRDEPIKQSIKAFDNWSPEAIFGEDPSNQPVNDNNVNSFVFQQPQYVNPLVQSNDYKQPKKTKPNTSPDLDSFNPNQINFNQNNNSYKPYFGKPYSQPQLQVSPHPPIKYYNDSKPMEVLNSYDSQSIQQQPSIQEENLPPDERPIKPMKHINNIFQQQQISLLTCNTDNTDYPPRKSLHPSPSPGKKYLFNSDYPPHQSPYKSEPPKKSFLFHNDNKTNNNNKRNKTPVITDEDINTHLNYQFDKPLHLADSSKFPVIKSKKPPTPPTPPLFDDEMFNEYQSPIQSPPSQPNQYLYQPTPPKPSSPPKQSPPPMRQSPLIQQPQQQQLYSLPQQQPQQQPQYTPYEHYSPLQQISPLQSKQYQQQQYQQNYYQNDEIENEIKPSFDISEKKKKKKKKSNKTKSPNKAQSISGIRSALEEERKKMKAIVAIQSLYRMRKVRKVYKDVIERRVKRKKKINMKKRKKAALIIQKAYRRHLQLLYEAILRERKRHVRCGNCGSTEASGLYCKKCGYRIKQNINKKDNNKKKVNNNNNINIMNKLNTKPKTTLPKINVKVKGVKVNKKDDRKLNNSPIQIPKSYKGIRSEVKTYKKKF